MLTQCPGCQTVFRITGAILRAAHGQVRCGRCNTQFDAVQNAFDEELVEEQKAPQPPDTSDKTAYLPPRQGSATADEATAFMSATADHSSTQHEQITMEGDQVDSIDSIPEQQPSMAEADADDSIIEIFSIDSEEWHTPFPPLPDAEQANAEIFGAPAADSVEENPHTDELTRVRERLFGEQPEEPSPFELAEASDDLSQVMNTEGIADAEAFNETIYLTGMDDASGAHNDEVIDIGAPSEDMEEAFTPEPVPDAEPESILERTRLRRWATSRSPPKEPPPDVLDPDQHIVEETTQRWPMVLACIGLSVLLTGQVLHHYRQTLVRHPSFGTTLKTIYAALGHTLEPRWDIKAYSIKQWGIVSDPQEPGVLRVRASITNNAPFAQPYPFLKLVLEDRFGTRLGTRAFKPLEYLPTAVSATRLLDAGVAANVDLAIVDPGEEAVGFQFDSCLGTETAMRCAHD